MKKIALMITVLVFGVGLTACVPIPDEIDTSYTESELRDLIEDVFEEQQDNVYTEDEIKAIIEEYVATTVVATTLTDQEIEDLIEQLILESSVATIYTQTELEDLIAEMIALSDVAVSYSIENFQLDITTVLAEVKDGVVGVVASINEDESSSGSGVIYKKDGDEYYVVTNEHVIEGSTEVAIVYEKNSLLFTIPAISVEVIGMDATTDIAVLKFTSDVDFTVIEFADSYEITEGDFVFAIGNPLGFDYYGTVTMGVISGTARYVQNDDVFDATLLQHDAAISPGNSGGALVDLEGKLVGINNMKIVTDDVSGIGFAIPSNTVQRVIDDLEDDGIIQRPYLGITSYVQVNDCGLDYGVCINIVEGGAAEDAGLRDGDVITGYKNLSTGMEEYLDIWNFNDLREAILNSNVTDTIQLRYIREDVEYESSTAVLGLHPDDLPTE